MCCTAGSAPSPDSMRSAIAGSIRRAVSTAGNGSHRNESQRSTIPHTSSSPGRSTAPASSTRSSAGPICRTAISATAPDERRSGRDSLSRQPSQCHGASRAHPWLSTVALSESLWREASLSTVCMAPSGTGGMVARVSGPVNLNVVPFRPDNTTTEDYRPWQRLGARKLPGKAT